MMFSIVVPVYNRPDEIREFLLSLNEQDYQSEFEVVVVEDGSSIRCKEEVLSFSETLNISYYYKDNSGPGDSRNFGMKVAKGEYFLIFDSDCIIPPHYLTTVDQELSHRYVDCFGGPDAALASFSDVQKAINFAMTSILTTGGIRGGSESLSKFQPRSFNMGISKKAFEASNGFGMIHPGEDPDLSIRLWKLGYETRLISSAYVFHKRRIDWNKFYIQVNKFGKARPILDSWYPEYSKITFWFPTLFVIGVLISVILAVAGIPFFLYAVLFYFFLAYLLSSFKSGSMKISLLSVIAVGIQFYGYGTGFLKSFVLVRLFKKNPETALPEMFFKK